MSDSMTSPLELWNESRRLAAVTYDISEGNTEFEAVQSEHPNFPFVSREEVKAIVKGTSGDTRAETVECLQRIINDRLKNTVTVTVGGVYDNSGVIEEWNSARSAATEIHTWIDAADSEQTAYETIQRTHQGLLPESEREAEELLSGISAESYQERHSELTRVLHTRLKNSGGHSTEEPPVDDEVAEIADDLVSVFIDRDESNYRDIVNKFADIEFPPRNVVLMEVMNAAGGSRTEKKSSLVEWVQTWHDDPTVLADMQEDSPRPMGMGSR